MTISKILAVGLFALPLSAATVAAQDAHTMLAPDDVKWASAPPSLPAGAEAAVLYGDPGKEGLFALRLKLPAGYAIPPHTHPKPELVTVISGEFKLGMGETADESQTEGMPAGSFVGLPPETAHFVFFDEETVLQLNSTGPWTLNYVNPADDPRQKSQ